MKADATASSFDQAATQVQRRLGQRRWLQLLSKCRWWSMAAVIVAGVVRASPWLPLSVLLGVLLSLAYWTWRSRPGRYEALALWDQVKGRSEAFAAAWWFSRKAERSPLEQRHLATQQALLPQALLQLPRDLPLQASRWLPLLPIVTGLAIAFNAWHPLPVGDQPLNEAMQAAAKQEAARLTSDDWQKKKLQGLNDAEKQALAQLKQDVAVTAKQLEQGQAGSTRELLSRLEQRARDAEKLAERLDTQGNAWASEKMIEAMRKHVDTADLGDATANRQSTQTAKAATDLAAVLRNPQLSVETRERFTETLRDISAQAETKDRERTVGFHVLTASDHLNQQQVPAAAQEFEELAKKMRDAAQREQARKELEQLAQQLRDAGSRIAGQQGGGMQQMAEAQQAAQATAGTPQGAQPMMSPQGSSQSSLQAPGLGQSQSQMQMQQPGNSTGQQEQRGLAQGQQQPGPQGQGAQDKPTLFAPDPRAKADQQPSTLLFGQGPSPESSNPRTTIAMPGGQQAGNGKAKLDAAPTLPSRKAGPSAVVNAASGQEGASSSRSVEGGMRQEAAIRQNQQMAVDLIREQEAALDDAALPPARREQVRRYFQELRKRFESP